MARSLVCSIWYDNSYSALRPSSGAAPACAARPFTSSVACAMPAAPSSSDSPLTTALAAVGSKDSTVSCRSAVVAMSSPEPTEPTSSSGFTSTVSVS
ncbi:hypothetical protein D9M69_608530 [compost metagenome]